jgi:hypothetical protein
MSDPTMQVYIDFLSNQPKTEQVKEQNSQMMRERFEQRLPAMSERIWELPAIVLHNPDGEYVQLLLESRELFIAGFFYSCVAMCGIVGERLIKDMFREAVLIFKEGRPPFRPKSEAFDQLERVEVNGIIRFLNEAGLLDDAAKKAAEDLGGLRNKYAHARGKEPEADAIKAVIWLHGLVEGTVSVFTSFEIKDGAFVRKAETGVQGRETNQDCLIAAP